jgi:hypothetical protein
MRELRWFYTDFNIKLDNANVTLWINPTNQKTSYLEYVETQDKKQYINMNLSTYSLKKEVTLHSIFSGQ